MRTKTKILKTKAEVKQLIKACKKMGYCCYDWETNGKPLYNHDFAPTILSITFQPGFACNIVMDHFQREEYGIEYSTKWAIKTIGHQLIEDYKVVKMAWNHKFDGQIFQKYHIYYRGTVIDGMLAKYILNEEKPNGLKDMTRRYLPEYGNYESDRGFDKIPWDQKPLDQLCQYGGQDTDYTFRLCIFFEKKLIDLGLYDLFRNLIMPASRVLQSVEANGLYIDREFNEKLLEEYKQKIDKALDNILNLPKVKRFQRYWKQQRVDKYLESIQEEIEKFNEELEDATDDKVIKSLNKKIASREQKITNIRAGVFTTKKEQELMAQINLGSNKDLPALIYSEEGLGFTCTEFTETGNPSTSEDTLQQLRLTVKKPDSPKAIFLDNLLDLRGLQKMYTTFIEGWHEKTQDDNKLHGSFKIHGCVTGNTKLIGKESDIIIKDICPKEPGVINVEEENIWILSSECTWEQVTHTINKGKLPTYKIITSTGETLKCTEGHKVLTTKGWKTVKQAFKKGLSIIMYDTSKFDITKPIVGKKSSEVVFKEVSCWPGYLVTNEGKVYSVKVQGGRGILDYNHPHELVPRYINNRPRVYFRNNTGKKIAFSVAHLVWLTFNNQTNIPSGMVVDHINGDPMDNRPENLQCITASENIKRAYSMTRSSYTNGSTNGNNKFDTFTVGRIIEDYSKGITQKEICIKYNISQKQVSGIVLKQRRKEVYISKIISFEYIGERYIYDLSVNDKHSYITRSNFINSNTTSGRLSSSEPNLQQIPKTSVDPNIKKQLIAKPGTLYISSDFSQAELRIMAHLSGDETYLKAFAEGNDPHLAIACKKYHVPYEDILPKYKDEEDPDHKVWSVRRKQAKQLAFGLIYGIGPGLLSVKLSDPKAGIIVTKEESKRQMDEYFDEHPALQKFKAKQEKVLKKNGFLKSLFGRKRRLPQVYSSNNDEVAYANRLGLNFPCLLPTSQALCKTKGWVNASDLTVGDEILAFNPRTGKSEWEPVLEVHEPDYDGDMYRFSSKHCGILSTSYHRWYVSKSEEFEKDISHRQYQDKIIEDFFTLQKTIHDKYESGKNLHQISIELGLPYNKVRRIYYGKVKSPLTSGITEPFKVMTSEEIYNSKGNCRIPIRAKHYNTNENTYTDNFIALCGWYLTDASIRRNKVVRITQSDSANHNKVVHIRELLKNSGLKYKEHIRISKVYTVVTWDISKEDSIKFMEVLPNRKLNMDFISSLTQSQLETLLYNMRLGDGYSILCSCDKEQASLIQAIVVLIGKTSSMFRLSYKGKRSYFKGHKLSKLGQEYIEATKDSWGIKLSDRLSIHTKIYGNKKVDKVPYQGKVWCPSVPSGAFFVRYIGDDGRYRTMITGNCQSAASDMCLFGSILIYYLMRQGKLPKMDSVTLVHDANYFNTTPEKINVWSLYEMWKIFSNPSTKKYFGFQIDDVLMDMDYHVGRTMAEELPFIPGYDYRKMLEPDFDVKEYMEEAKKFASIPISDYPKHFAKEMKKYEEDFKAGKY